MISYTFSKLRLRSLRTKFSENKTGNVLILFGLTLPMMVGFAGLGTDTIQWTLIKQQLQRSADSAALNGAFARAQMENASTNANNDLTRTLDGFQGVSITVQNAPTSGAFAGNNRAVKVILSYTKKLPFSSLFISNPPEIRVEATAAVLNNGDYCVISLEDTNANGITFSGNSTVDLGCGVASNATGTSAVTAIGSTLVTASPIAAVGYVPPSTNYQKDTVLIPFSIPQRDPFASLSDPTSDVATCTGGAITVSPSETTKIEPGCYTNIKIQGTLTMIPGTYYVKGGDFETTSQANLTAKDVTIVLTGDGANIGKVNMNGGSNIVMSASTTGVYEDVLFFKDRNAPATFNDVFNGGASGSFLGAIYMPSQIVTLNGNSNFTTNCLQIVARNVVITGNTRITNDCPPTGGPDAFVGTQVRLVG